MQKRKMSNKLDDSIEFTGLEKIKDAEPKIFHQV
jgi:hypothetical protein